jgi:putative lipoic acid-binding regulatory protein
MQVLDASGSESLLKFPAEHDFKAMGPAGAAFVARVVDALAVHVAIDRSRVSHRASGKATYWAVTVPAWVDSHAQLLAAYTALKALPEVKWTL